jgi:hypothetical protein
MKQGIAIFAIILLVSVCAILQINTERKDVKAKVIETIVELGTLDDIIHLTNRYATIRTSKGVYRVYAHSSSPHGEFGDKVVLIDKGKNKYIQINKNALLIVSGRYHE